MSHFSVYLRNLVEESGIPHATLARMAGINRSNLLNVLSGSRKPSRRDVECMLPHLRASVTQQAELLELLEGELLGPDVVQRRACVRDMLERLDQSFQATPVPRQVWPAASGTSRGAELLSGDAAILNTLAALLSEGSRQGGRLVFFPGFPKSWLQRSLSILWGLDARGLQVTQAVEFWKAPQAEAAAANLQALSDALPMLLSSRFDYELWYTYAAHVELPHVGVLFPYCLLLPQAVFLLHRDGPAGHGPPGCGDAALLAGGGPGPAGRGKAPLQPELRHPQHPQLLQHRGHPAPPGGLPGVPALPRALCRRGDPGPADPAPGARAREDLIQAILAYGDLLRRQNYIGLFYEGGLRLFAETGFIYDLPRNGSLPAPPEIRKTVLERLCRDCEEGERVLRIARPQRLRLPQDVMIAVREDVGTHFVLPLENSGEYYNIQIGEVTITEAFLDFLTAAADSAAVCPQEETLEKLRRTLRSL